MGYSCCWGKVERPKIGLAESVRRKREGREREKKERQTDRERGHVSSHGGETEFPAFPAILRRYPPQDCHPSSERFLPSHPSLLRRSALDCIYRPSTRFLSLLRQIRCHTRCPLCQNNKYIDGSSYMQHASSFTFSRHGCDLCREIPKSKRARGISVLPSHTTFGQCQPAASRMINTPPALTLTAKFSDAC